MNRNHFLACATMLALVSFVTSFAKADPYPNQVLKFNQQPMVALQVLDATGVPAEYNGHDELSTARFSSLTGSYEGTYMADDFADTFRTPVVHVSWWGSYLLSPVLPNPVQKFLIAWETDVAQGDPLNPVPYSHPGSLIQAEIVTVSTASLPAAGQFTEQLVHPGGQSNNFEALYKYNAELALPFAQDPDTVYWLKIVALIDNPDDFTQWGWHNRDYTLNNAQASIAPNVNPGEAVVGVLPDGQSIWHFQDDAVTGQVVVGVQPGTNQVTFVDQPFWSPTNYINGVDGPGPGPGFLPGTTFPGIGAFSKDLAFQLYTVPEPGSVALIAVGGLMMLRRRS